MRLTEYSHGAGWACKLSPGELAQVLTQFKNHKATESPNLLVGLNNPDDGGVIQVGDQKIIQTVDFFTPILDNPYDWGKSSSGKCAIRCICNGRRTYFSFAVSLLAS